MPDLNDHPLEHLMSRSSNLDARTGPVWTDALLSNAST